MVPWAGWKDEGLPAIKGGDFGENRSAGQVRMRLLRACRGHLLDLKEYADYLAAHDQPEKAARARAQHAAKQEQLTRLWTVPYCGFWQGVARWSVERLLTDSEIPALIERASAAAAKSEREERERVA
ncbi:MAG TPA: hypothetical protein VFU47_16370 [Armatimonadota bacterium]|nr:hypothetical protein [Armatimonadota bacterium]